MKTEHRDLSGLTRFAIAGSLLGCCLLGGCSPVLDCTSKDTMQISLGKVRRSVPPEHRETFDKTLDLVCATPSDMDSACTPGEDRSLFRFRVVFDGASWRRILTIGEDVIRKRIASIEEQQQVFSNVKVEFIEIVPWKAPEYKDTKPVSAFEQRRRELEAMPVDSKETRKWLGMTDDVRYRVRNDNRFPISAPTGKLVLKVRDPHALDDTFAFSMQNLTIPASSTKEVVLPAQEESGTYYRPGRELSDAFDSAKHSGITAVLESFTVQDPKAGRTQIAFPEETVRLLAQYREVLAEIKKVK